MVTAFVTNVVYDVGKFLFKLDGSQKKRTLIKANKKAQDTESAPESAEKALNEKEIGISNCTPTLEKLDCNLTELFNGIEEIRRNDEAIKEDIALEEIYEILHSIKLIEDLSSSYETRLESVNCYTSKLKKYRDCALYHANLNDCKEYYKWGGVCHQALCIRYKAAVYTCLTLKYAPEQCEGYDEEKHKACYKVPELCKGTSAAQFTHDNKQFDRKQLEILRNNLIRQEKDLGFSRHDYDSQYSTKIKEEARLLQKELAQNVSKYFKSLYEQGTTNTSVKNYLTQFQENFCATHNCTEEVEVFTLQSRINDCITVYLYNVTIYDHITSFISTFVQVAETACCGKIACGC